MESNPLDEKNTASKGFRKSFFRWSVFLAVIIWLFSGFYFVKPEEEAVRRRFKRIVNQRIGPGLHYHLPYPVEEARKLRTSTVYKVGIGVNIYDIEQNRLPRSEDIEHLSGDTNILDLKLTVQYTIRNPGDFLFYTGNPKAILKRCGEAILTEIAASMDVDDLLTTGKSRLTGELDQMLQKKMDLLGTGIAISSINLIGADPPAAVKQAFQEAVDARADRERLIHEATTYRNQLIPRAQGEATRITENAKGQREDILSSASGDADKFYSILNTYRISPKATSLDLFLETTEDVLRKARIIVSPGAGNPLNVFSGKFPVNSKTETIDSSDIPSSY